MVTPEVRSRAAELTKGASTDEEKLEAIYNYVATKFRYVSISFGIGRYQPHSAAEVMKNAYGDCKDKQTLLATLLAAAGVPAYAALINSFRKIDVDVPSPGQFDHVIGVIPLGKSWVWADTTSEVAPLGFLTSNLRDRQALVILPSGAPSLVATPAAPPFREFQTVKLEGRLDDDGTLEGKVERTARGGAELGLRSDFRDTPPAEWKDIVAVVAYGTSFGGGASDVTATNPEVTGTPFSYSYRFKTQDTADWTYKRLLIQVPVFGLPVLSDEQGLKKREYPLDLGSVRDVSVSEKIDLPAGYTPKLLPPVDLSTGFADYHSAYAFKDGTLTLERHLAIKAKEIPVTELPAYRSFQRAVNDDTLAYTYMLTGAESMATLPPNPEAAQIIEEAREAYQRQDLKGALELLERAVKVDPQFPAAWLALGYLRTAAGQRQEGLAAYRRAVELVPNDLTARKALAAALFGSSPDEDIQALRDVLKLDPRDRQAHTMLGNILLDQKKYTEAATELEAAAALSTPNSSLQEKIAEAYFGADEKDKGVGALKKMVDLDSHPPTWNRVASLLAEHDVNLGEAQQLAQKAVKTAEDGTAKVSLEKLEPDDVQRRPNLADYWGTLGWVYLCQGDLQHAARYLDAAWALAPTTLIGDHLGQLYEKQGKTQSAIEAYSLALAASTTPRDISEQIYARLLALLKNQAAVDAKLKVARQEFSRPQRTSLGKLTPMPGSAEVWLLLGRDGKVADLRFISGGEGFRSLGKSVSLLKFKTLFPDDASIRLLRRGVLVCAGGDYGCDFTLQDPRTVHSDSGVVHVVK